MKGKVRGVGLWNLDGSAMQVSLEEEEEEVITGEGSADFFLPALQCSRLSFSAGSVG